MELNGKIDVFDFTDKITGLTIRLADYDVILACKLEALIGTTSFVPGVKKVLDDFNIKVLNQMELTGWQVGEAPLYFWIRAMKIKNNLSFEDGVYDIPENLASCIVRCSGARQFIRILTGGGL